MSASFAHTPFMPCPECGASVEVAAATDHVCDPDRRLDFVMFQLRAEVSALGAEIEDFFSSARGRFEQWYADQERRKPTGDEPTDEPRA